jgi:hypothetical protein
MHRAYTSPRLHRGDCDHRQPNDDPVAGRKAANRADIFSMVGDAEI